MHLLQSLTLRSRRNIDIKELIIVRIFRLALLDHINIFLLASTGIALKADNLRTDGEPEVVIVCLLIKLIEQGIFILQVLIGLNLRKEQV